MPVSKENHKALVEFASVAEEFCRLMDSLRQGRPPRFYQTLERLLENLHRVILPVEKESPDTKHPEFDKLAMTHEQWKDMAKIIGENVGQETYALFKEHGGEKPDANEVEKYLSIRANMLDDDLAARGESRFL